MSKIKVRLIAAGERESGKTLVLKICMDALEKAGFHCTKPEARQDIYSLETMEGTIITRNPDAPRISP